MIKSIEHNKFINSDDSARYLYQLHPKDLEQLTVDEIHSEIGHIKRGLNQLDTNRAFKVYHLNDAIYADLEDERGFISYYGSSPCNDGVIPFFGLDNVFSNPTFKADYCKLNGFYFRFVSLNLSEDHEIDIADLQGFGDYVMAFKRKKTMFAKQMVNDARKLTHANLYKALADIEGIEAYRENEEMLRRIITREEELFDCEFYYVIRSATEDELVNKTTRLIEELNARGLSPYIETQGLNSAFNCFTPGSTPEFNRKMVFHSSLLANALPTTDDQLMDSGVFFQSRSGKPVAIDIMKGDSYSLLITGLTGKGKTTCANKMIDHELLDRGRAGLILDPKRDFRKNALLKKSQIINQKIDPMIFKDDKFLRNCIISMIPESERTRLLEGKLLASIRKNEAHKERDFFEALNILEKDGFSDISYYFEDLREHIGVSDTDKVDLTYIEFNSFRNESIPLLLCWSMEYCRQLNRPYFLLIDEAHRVFKSNPYFLEERVREMRGANCSLIPLTQNYFWMLETDFGQVVADNCNHKIFFQQALKPSGLIDEFDVAQIHSLETRKGEYSQFYYKNDSGLRKVCVFAPTPYELEVYTSEQEQTDALLNYVSENSKYFSVNEIVANWVRMKYA